MLTIIRAFLDIALLRLGPEDLPASGFLLGAALVVYTVVQIPLTWIVFQVPQSVMITLLVDVVLLVGGLWVLLRLTGFPSRFGQTLTALLGTGALLSVLSLPFNIWSASVAGMAQRPAAPSAAILAIVLWSFVINGHILGRAISRSFAIGLLISIAYFFIHMTVLFEFAPLPG